MNSVPVNKLFNLRLTNATKNGSGQPIEFDTLEARTDGSELYLAKIKNDYLFPVEQTIAMGIALNENIPSLLWGPHGSGKSTLIEQMCVRCNRPSIRMQHSVDTEKADINGMWVLEGEKMAFHYGPLARAMKYGLVYIADEYDFALPNVLSVYQAVLEGEPLIIPNVPEELAIVHPHPDFRFFATGNTNGGGDETGLYQGTQMQNAANYSRFGITAYMDYSSEEKKMLTGLFGDIPDADLNLIMNFTKLVREATANKIITNAFSTRELITVTRLAILRGRDKLNFRWAIDYGFCNRMSSMDAAAVRGIVDRVFGK